MGLLDDIKKLRARAESLNNNHGKSKLSKESIFPSHEDSSAPKKNFRKDYYSQSDFNKELNLKEENSCIFEPKLEIDPRVEEKPRVDSKLQAFRQKARTQSNYNNIKTRNKNKRSDFFKKPYEAIHDQKKQNELKANFYESFNIKFIIIVISLILVFALLRIDISFRSVSNEKIPSGSERARVPNDNQAYYLDKSLVLTSGMFSTQSQAKIAQNRIRNITEQESKIIKIADYYTIQIGGHYFNKENAFYVLNELSTSGIKDISLRLQ